MPSNIKESLTTCRRVRMCYNNIRLVVSNVSDRLESCATIDAKLNRISFRCTPAHDGIIMKL